MCAVGRVSPFFFADFLCGYSTVYNCLIITMPGDATGGATVGRWLLSFSRIFYWHSTVILEPCLFANYDARGRWCVWADGSFLFPGFSLLLRRAAHLLRWFEVRLIRAFFRTKQRSPAHDDGSWERWAEAWTKYLQGAAAISEKYTRIRKNSTAQLIMIRFY